MTDDSKAISVRQKLLNTARSSGDDYNQILTRYASLRFLTRLAKSKYSDRFLLKGATMFLVWNGSVHRPTKDIDLLGFMSADEALLGDIMRDVCVEPTDQDGMQFDISSIQVEQIREDNAYGGLRCRVLSSLGTAQIPIQIDIGFGDDVTPEPVEVTIPRLLADEQPQTIRAYTPETGIAEKLEAIVKLGLANSRMKDYLDIDILLSGANVRDDVLQQAILRTFKRRETELPKQLPLGLTEVFWNDAKAIQRWRASLTKNRLKDDSLESICRRIGAKVLPILSQLSAGAN